ncbi:hypothetical protein BDW71DRAFT_19036 [Aspergillus fruticulosus]
MTLLRINMTICIAGTDWKPGHYVESSERKGQSRLAARSGLRRGCHETDRSKEYSICSPWRPSPLSHRLIDFILFYFILFIFFFSCFSWNRMTSTSLHQGGLFRAVSRASDPCIQRGHATGHSLDRALFAGISTGPDYGTQMEAGCAYWLTVWRSRRVVCHVREDSLENSPGLHCSS